MIRQVKNWKLLRIWNQDSVNQEVNRIFIKLLKNRHILQDKLEKALHIVKDQGHLSTPVKRDKFNSQLQDSHLLNNIKVEWNINQLSSNLDNLGKELHLLVLD